METIKNEYPLKAEWWRRLIGALIDSIIVSIFAEMIIDAKGVNEDHIERAVYYSVYLVYCFIFEWIFNRTIGKFTTGTIVISTRTFERPTFGQILGRTFIRLIFIESLSFISKRPFGLHDSIPKTMVTTISEKRRYQIANPLVQNSSQIVFINRFLKLKSLNQGIYRVIITLSVFLPLLFSIMAEVNDDYSEGGTFVQVLIIGIAIYWILIFVWLWIYEGFKEGK